METLHLRGNVLFRRERIDIQMKKNIYLCEIFRKETEKKINY